MRLIKKITLSFLSVMIINVNILTLAQADDFVPGELLIKFRPTITQSEVVKECKRLGIKSEGLVQAKKALLKQVAVKEIAHIPAIGVRKLKLEQPDKIRESLEELKKSGLVEYCEPNYIRKAVEIYEAPNDPWYQQGKQSWIQEIGADKVVAQEVMTEGEEIIIAIIDTGVMLDHQDLRERIVPGIDLVNSDNSPYDDQGHGTAMAGAAAAQTNNGLGIAGTASFSGIKIMPIKVLNHEGRGPAYLTAEGIIWAVDNRARVLNLSLSSSFKSRAEEEAVAYAYEKNCVILAAAGNSGHEGNSIEYPAALEQAIGVAACDSQGSRAFFSQYHNYVDIAAPGVDILTTALPKYSNSSSEYASGSGTSPATAIVSGVAAMILAQDARRTSYEVKNLLTTTAVKTGSLIGDKNGWNKSLGWGRVNIYKALLNQKTVFFENKTKATYNYPNPFKPKQGQITRIVIPLSQGEEPSKVSLNIYDAIGNIVKKIELSRDEIFPGGTIIWDGKNGQDQAVANGVYFYTLKLKDKIYKNKIVVLDL